MADSTVSGAPDSAPTLSQIFFAFFAIAISGFGGVMPWAHRTLVERKNWLSHEKFAEDVALAQFLPGPNIINLSIVVGSRWRGPAGALAACVGLMIAPVILMIAFGELYSRFGDASWLNGPLEGLSAWAVGLIVAMTAKLAKPMFHGRRYMAIFFAAVAFAVVGFLRVPLWWALIALAPLSVAAFWWRLR